MTLQNARKRVYSIRLAACKTAGIKKALGQAGFDVLAAID
jgi:hypothetical protein